MALANVSSIEANAKIDPKIGPIHGVHPKPKANPITTGKKKLSNFLKSNLLSIFKKPKLKTPNNCKEKNMITKPAINLND